MADASQHSKKCHVIIVGNEKGGSGKTTTTMHLIVGLLQLGFNVGSIDLDSRQRSLTRYLENRRQYLFKHGAKLMLPQHVVVNRSPFGVDVEAQEDERTRFAEAIGHLSNDNDFIVIDCPGSDMYLSRVAHSYADTVITPINDSFVDLDLLAHINPDTFDIVKPSLYSEMLWEQKLEKAKKDNTTIDWVVMRNRLSNLDAKNKRRMADVVTKLSKRVGFRVAPGFSERVIFRELFLYGLTVLDVMQMNTTINVNMSHIAAREEVRKLLRALNLERVSNALKEQLQLDNRRNRSTASSTQKATSTAPKTTPSAASSNVHTMSTTSPSAASPVTEQTKNAAVPA